MTALVTWRGRCEVLAESRYAIPVSKIGKSLRTAATSYIDEHLAVFDLDWIDLGWDHRGKARRSVRAADVVVVDLEHRDAGRLRLVREHEVAVRLIRVGARCALLDADQPRVDRACDILQRALEQQVGRGVADLVVLQRVEVEELFARREVDALQLCGGARSHE